MSGDDEPLPSGTRDALDAVERLLHRHGALEPGDAAVAARLILDGRPDTLEHIQRVLRPPGERDATPEAADEDADPAAGDVDEEPSTGDVDDEPTADAEEGDVEEEGVSPDDDPPSARDDPPVDDPGEEPPEEEAEQAVAPPEDA